MKYQEELAACTECIASTNVCLIEHMGEKEMKTCHQLCLDCLSVCTACVQLMARNSDYLQQVTRVCTDLCNQCAEECDKFDSDVCKDCAKACRRCAEACGDIS
ncbi:MAG: four-helix bundle copper-binding protein [Balneolaceae bacterium]